ncbi:uncharacterized protein LOC143056957 [Mytilus galloprovincialis]
MRMLKIDTLQENDFVVNLIKAELGLGSLDDFIWTGLRRDSTGNEKWTDNAAPAWTNYAIGNPTTTSGSFCFALNPPNGDWLEHSCSQKHMFVCEMDVGQCTFDQRPAGKGCNSAPIASPDYLASFEISQSTCKTKCLDSVNTNDVECWAAAYLPGCSCDDCWLFNSKDTDYCLKNEDNYVGVTLFIKICFEGEMQTLTTKIITTVEETTTLQFTDATSGFPSTNIDVLTTDVSTDFAKSCDCSLCNSRNKTISSNISTEEMQQSIDKIVSDIKVDKKSTSHYKRTLTSAEDKRLSSRVIGISGTVILIFSLVFILGTDIGNLFNALRAMYRRLKGLN